MRRNLRVACIATALIAIPGILMTEWVRSRRTHAPSGRGAEVHFLRVALLAHTGLYGGLSVFVSAGGRTWWREVRPPQGTENGMQESVWSGTLSGTDLETIDRELWAQDFLALTDVRTGGVPDEGVFTLEASFAPGSSKSVTTLEHQMAPGFAAIRERLVKTASGNRIEKQLVYKGDLREGWRPPDW
jgi:hypothetical protein